MGLGQKDPWVIDWENNKISLAGDYFKEKKDYPSIRSGFACLDDFILITKEGNYIGTSFFRVFLNFVFLFMLGTLITIALDIGLAYVTVWNVAAGDFLSEFTFIFHLFLFLIAIRFLPLTQYHSLEHKVANLIDEKKEINYENVKNITGYSKYCGSNLIGLLTCYMVLIPVLNMIGFAWFWSALIAVNIIFPTRFDKVFGKWMQEKFALQQPTEKQIEMAVKKGRNLIEQYKSGKSVSYINLKIITVGAMAFTLAISYRLLLMTLFGG